MAPESAPTLTVAVPARFTATLFSTPMTYTLPTPEAITEAFVKVPFATTRPILHSRKFFWPSEVLYLLNIL